MNTDKYTPRHAKPGWNVEHTIYQRAFHEGIAARRLKQGITPRHARDEGPVNPDVVTAA
ncbi:hypothetical protein [Jonesia denitrificans]|uniref:Uncharacterized protein n=1 Tax=Jonesia denitrificans (strain ATCC 14870 / DSM 20603 / BCRC 15368 / CIP 55.134 / JCM 11481 / NBRC 15587 / NCTC 10816 / Prevot 55134) TaxID=471856 RepID=C7R145_JONDD|nr:hypothetical protein [Jonesia denitrificans]ACV09769.1 hypothetical protein Jden_2132 [Jonesia denitrificans DSM 20603]QXB43571.1 hypothetical protein I6L70_01300 [Jonesia denitrificans]SQH22375.1 Uncharacterised protein [Jonesia denitrificans]